MTHRIIDRRLNPEGKSLPNRQRFIERNRKTIHRAARERLRKGDLKDIASDTPKRLNTGQSRDTHEPKFHHGEGGSVETVLPGNKKFMPGDRIPHPQGEGGGGQRGSPDGGGENDFFFEVSQKEFLEIIFEGMELPDMVKKVLIGQEEFELERAGFSVTGPPNKMDMIRSTKNAQVRRRAFRASLKQKERALEAERENIIASLESTLSSEQRAKYEERLKEIDSMIETLKRRMKAVPFFDTADLRFRRHEEVPKPVTKAVMFAILDASGSMDEWKIEMAKRFLLLLYLFLERNYERIDVVLIRHTQHAKEVDSDEFFSSRETGGTIVSSALILMAEIIKARYKLSEWNIYGCQASDGDDYEDDLPIAQATLKDKIMPLVQYFAYIEIEKGSKAPRGLEELFALHYKHSSLWRFYLDVKQVFPHLAMAKIGDSSAIYPTLRELFKARAKKGEH